jgi:uracil-DNA glycosylase
MRITSTGFPATPATETRRLRRAQEGQTQSMAASTRTHARELANARLEAEGCRRCDVWRDATRVVFGEGPTRARAMLVGEQPGDVEDRAGRPFVGPAGILLRKLIAEAGLEERDLYLTNAVKHFKWRPKGTRRIHDKPNWTEVRACDHWLRLELAHVRPQVVVCLGSTAAQALLGREARVYALRGAAQRPPGLDAQVVVTIHPSAVLRAGEQRSERRAELLEDLTLARSLLAFSADRSRVRPALTAAESERRSQMPPRGVKKGTKRARQYEHIKESLEKRGESEGTAEEIAARTVNKERARRGEARESSRLSREDISSGRRGGLRAHRSGPRGRTRDQLYEEAREKGVEGRSKMTKAELARAVGRQG